MAGISDRKLNDLEAQTQGEDHSESELMPEEDIYKGDWYVVHTYSGYENKIKEDLTKRVASMNMEDKIFSVFVPEVEETEYKGGKKKTVVKRLFPGYVLVNMILDDESWYVVHNTPGVTGFVGSGTRPIPLQPEEVDYILHRQDMQKQEQFIDVSLGDSIKVRTGPFTNFEGTVQEIMADRGKLRVHISMFGRETPVELDYEQIEKI